MSKKRNLVLKGAGRGAMAGELRGRIFNSGQNSTYCLQEQLNHNNDKFMSKIPQKGREGGCFGRVVGDKF